MVLRTEITIAEMAKPFPLSLFFIESISPMIVKTNPIGDKTKSDNISNQVINSPDIKRQYTRRVTESISRIKPNKAILLTLLFCSVIEFMPIPDSFPITINCLFICPASPLTSCR